MSKIPIQNPSHCNLTVQSLFNCKRRKKLIKKLKSPRIAPIQKPHSQILPQFEQILDRDAQFRFLHRSTAFLRGFPGRVLPVVSAHKYYQQLGVPRGRKVAKFASDHPLLFQITSGNFMFTELMERLLDEEIEIIERTMEERIKVVNYMYFALFTSMKYTPSAFVLLPLSFLLNVICF